MYVCASTRERACRNRMPACTYECACACERVYACTHARGPMFGADVCMYACVCMRMHLGCVRVADMCMHARIGAMLLLCLSRVCGSSVGRSASIKVVVATLLRQRAPTLCFATTCANASAGDITGITLLRQLAPTLPLGSTPMSFEVVRAPDVHALET